MRKMSLATYDFKGSPCGLFLIVDEEENIRWIATMTIDGAVRNIWV